jgi:hypothetical protein
MRPGILIFHAENAELRGGAGEKATQETNYEHETVSFVALLNDFAVMEQRADNDAHSQSNDTESSKPGGMLLTVGLTN